MGARLAARLLLWMTDWWDPPGDPIAVAGSLDAECQRIAGLLRREARRLREEKR